jgi:hypothetical protein
MSESKEEASRFRARLALLEQLVRLLYREQALQVGLSPEYIIGRAEVMKQFFEARISDIPAAYMTAEIDNFFNVLASDVRQRQENPGTPEDQPPGSEP